MMQIQIRIRIHVMFAIWLFSFNSRFLISSWLPSLIWLNPSNSGSITPWCSLNRNLLANCAHSCLPVFIYWNSAGFGSVSGSVFEFLDPYSEYGSGPGSRVKRLWLNSITFSSWRLPRPPVPCHRWVVAAAGLLSACRPHPGPAGPSPCKNNIKSMFIFSMYNYSPNAGSDLMLYRPCSITIVYFIQQFIAYFYLLVPVPTTCRSWLFLPAASPGRGTVQLAWLGLHTGCGSASGCGCTLTNMCYSPCFLNSSDPNGNV